MPKIKYKRNTSLKKITIAISNNELNAMEDFIVAELNKKEEEKFRKVTMGIWQKLVTAFDKLQ